MKELKFEELSIKQKIGMVTCGLVGTNHTDEGDEFVLNLIKEHALGSVWVNPKAHHFDEIMAKIKQAADYPILIFTDAESGLGDFTIGKHNALGMTDNEDLAYIFGKVTAINAVKMGYNVVCNPILDVVSTAAVAGANIRSMGSDKYRIAALGKAMARGMHDGGVLTVGKHYPSASEKTRTHGRAIDSHMAETMSYETKEQLIDKSLYAYRELMKEGLLDGIMTGHCRLPNIDDEYPTSLSKKVIGIIRELGFDGFAITDALSMMGVVAKFGWEDSKGLSVENGNDIALIWDPGNIKGFNAMYNSYEKGVLSEERINEATKIVLAAQHKIFEMQPKFNEITAEDKALFDKINTDSVFARVDEGLPTGISKDGRHYFVILTSNETDISQDGKVEVDTFNGGWHGGWYNPKGIMEKLKELFPNSESRAIRAFPTGYEIQCTLEQTLGYDDIIFISYFDAQAYIGKEAHTPRIISMIDALQVDNRVSTVVHFGSPYVLEDFVHIPRIIIGGSSLMGIDAAFNVLAGNYPAKGKLTYDVKFE